MMAFHSVLPEVAERELRFIRLEMIPGAAPEASLPTDDYAFVEFYCEDLGCDCRRVFLQVIGQRQPDRVLASINYGWESEAFYRERMPYDPDAPRQVVEGSLDPMNTQSTHSHELLELFREYVLDENYRLRLQRHHSLFREELRRAQNPSQEMSSASDQKIQGDPAERENAEKAIPVLHRERFKEVGALIDSFGQKHLDPELTGFAIELWLRICRRTAPDCLRGKTAVWAASVIHVIARMNFLFDRNQPVSVSFDTICGFFQANKTTVGSKATEIERTLRLGRHNEPGLCRRELLEAFTNVSLSNGMVLSWSTAKKMGYVPADARIEDLR